MNQDAYEMLQEGKRQATAKAEKRPTYTEEEMKMAAEFCKEERPTTRPKTTAALYGQMKEQ